MNKNKINKIQNNDGIMTIYFGKHLLVQSNYNLKNIEEQ